MAASLAHRASGIILVLSVPVYLWLLYGLTGSPENFQHVMGWLRAPLGRLMLWFTGSALIYHLINGIRFICLDAGIGEERRIMRLASQLVFAVSLFLSLVFGFLLW